jgi:thiosulfate dehydrogenase [quinone] large subunit
MTAAQKLSLPVLRILTGWQLLYQGVAKLLQPGWSAAGFLNESKWVLSGFSQWILSSDTILSVVTFLNIWGLIAIGLGLILGIFTRTAALSGAVLLLLYYLINPPLVGLQYSTNNLVINSTLVEAVALLVVAAFIQLDLFRLDCLFKFSKRK